MNTLIFIIVLEIVGGFIFGIDNNTIKYIKKDMGWNEKRRTWYNVVKQFVIVPFKISVYIANYLSNKSYLVLKLINKN